eukprot:gnl/TRDRNA2_/TRDRNA2_180091_c0_seq1.p1 gnl/TRDRNA2_/TRDRNA2_180091_c0~~gnl/TRDRNA2_/TRDRNA2_180091_c0_seq1.p1  ORF type:complete len:171 (+),score=26.98 gnl/TRDRNA2_/TRDRNA2_180091_c0_seq1:70-513(+)
MVPQNSEDGIALGCAYEEINGAIGTMQENMKMLVEREGQLNELQDKSASLQGASGEFARQAKKVRWEALWHQYRLWSLVCTFILWATLLWIFRDHLHAYLGISSAVIVLLYLAQRLFAKRWLAQLEADTEEARQQQQQDPYMWYMEP